MPSHEMSDTTIRVDVGPPTEQSHEMKVPVGSQPEMPLEALWRQRFAHHAMRQFSELQKDLEAWQEYMAEAEGTHVTDGIV